MIYNIAALLQPCTCMAAKRLLYFFLAGRRRIYEDERGRRRGFAYEQEECIRLVAFAAK